MMPTDLILPLSMVMGLAVYGLTAKWYVMPKLEALPRAKALQPLLLLHCFRFVGLAFLIPGVTAQLLDPRFATPAAYGDLLAALLALLAIIALRSKWRVAIPLVWMFNVEGTVDLLIAVTQVCDTPRTGLSARPSSSRWSSCLPCSSPTRWCS